MMVIYYHPKLASSVLLTRYGIHRTEFYHIQQLLTFDVYEGHPYPKLASAILLSLVAIEHYLKLLRYQGTLDPKICVQPVDNE